MTLDSRKTPLPETLRATRTNAAPPSAPDFPVDNGDALTKAIQENIYRSRLMAFAGHDLKQPLQVLGMLFERLALDVDESIAAPRLKLAHQAIKRIADGLDELALASKLDIGLDVPLLQAFPVADILLVMKPRWQEHALRNEVELRVVPCSGYVISNVAMLMAILHNLVGYAIKYTTRGRVLVGCRRVKDRLSIHVIDTGVGIAAEQLERIFVAFHQGDPSSDGLGLGLSIIQRTAAILGHPIRVRSAPGRGSSFTVDVPLDLKLSAKNAREVRTLRVGTPIRRPIIAPARAAEADAR